jgi:hypothetical protein
MPSHPAGAARLDRVTRHAVAAVNRSSPAAAALGERLGAQADVTAAVDVGTVAARGGQ